MDIEYRDMKRIKVDASSNKELMKYDNGHIDLKMKSLKRREEKTKLDSSRHD